MKHNISKYLLVGTLAFGSVLSGGLLVKKSTKTYTQVEAADYYASITDDLEGTALLNKLNDLIDNIGTLTKDRDYAWSRFEAADKDPNNKNNIITIYARTSLSKGAHVNSQNVGWNREHTFPQSKLTVTESSKWDNHMVYASDAKVNGIRGNKKMGEVSGGTLVSDSYGNETTARYQGDYFDPNNEARGIVARTTMYAATMYGYDPEDNFQTIGLMIKWHLENPVTSQDEYRNGVVYGNQGNRNPFVDHPEYACRIWGNNSAQTRELCGAAAKKSIEIKENGTKVTNLYINMNEERTFNSYVEGTLSSDVEWTLTKEDGTAYTGNKVTLNATGSSAKVTMTGKEDKVILKASHSYVDEKETPVIVNAKVNLIRKKTVKLDLSNVKTTYQLKEQFVKPTVKATFNDGEVRTVTNDTEFFMNGFDSSKAGKYSIGYLYGDSAGTFDVTVVGGAKANGCGGNIGTTSVILTSLAAAGIAAVVISMIVRRKKKQS